MNDESQINVVRHDLRGRVRLKDIAGAFHGRHQPHQRLGVPATPADYDFSTITNAPEGLVDTMRVTAHELNIPKDAAPKIIDAFLKFGEAGRAAEVTRAAAAAQVAKDALAAMWGASNDTNKFVADRAAAMLGITPEQMDALTKVSSYGTVMEGLRKMGMAMGEAKLITGVAGGSNQVFTREQALAKKEELMNDRDWVKAWNTGAKSHQDEIGNLNRIIVGPAPR